MLGGVAAADGGVLDVEITLEAGPGVLYDALVIPGGEAAVAAWARDANALDFVRLQYRHCKPLLLVGEAVSLLTKAGVPDALPDGSPDLALITAEPETLTDALSAFKAALAGHRSFAREADLPMV